MAQRSPNYALVLILLLISTGITAWARTRPALEILPADIASMPEKIGGWHKVGDDHVFDKETLDGWLVSDKNFLSRTYENDREERVTLMLVYKGLDRRGWHVSEMCFSGSGYNVTQGVTAVPYAGRNQDAVKLVADASGGMSSAVSIYWFANGPRAEHNFWKQQGQMALARLTRPGQGWAFIRVTSNIAISEDRTVKLIEDFIADASDDLVKAIAAADQSR